MKRIIILLTILCSFCPLAAYWTELSPEEILSTYGDLASAKGSPCGIRRLLKHTPDPVDPTKKPLALIVVHGTYAAESPEYTDSYGTRIQVCAQQLACEWAAPTRIIYYRWSGLNTEDARKQAGETLAKVIDLHSNFHIITIAHSHGGTVVNYASNSIKNPIDVMAHYAVPVMAEHPAWRPNNFKLLCNFYALSDIVQLIAATTVTKAFKEGLKLQLTQLAPFREHSAQTAGSNAGRIVNVRTRFHGYETDHSSIKNAIVVLPHLLEMLEKNYAIHNDLELNVDITQKDYPLLIMARNEQIHLEHALKETEFSLQQKQLYKKLYGHEISKIPPSLHYYSEIMANTLLLVPTIRQLCSDWALEKYLPQLSHIRF